MNDKSQTTKSKDNKSSFWSVMLSVIAAAFGVQKRSQHQRDFEHKSPWPFIAGGILFTIAFVITLILIVNTVLPS